MSIFDVLADFFRDTVYHAPATGFTGVGKPIYGDETAYACRIARKQSRVVGKSGEIAVSRAQIWFATPPIVINFGDQVRLPAGVLPGDATTTHAIVAVESWPGDDGVLCTKAYL